MGGVDSKPQSWSERSSPAVEPAIEPAMADILPTQYDSRKVARGSCSVCNCGRYDGSGGTKCAGCSHAPGKHMNLSNPTSPRPVNSGSATELASEDFTGM